MKKIKVLMFNLSEFDDNIVENDIIKKREEFIDKTINDFIKDKNVVDIKVNVHHNKNDSCDTINLIYTIIYSI